MIGNFPAVLNFNRLFLKLDRFICNSLPVLPDHRCGLLGSKVAAEASLCNVDCKSRVGDFASQNSIPEVQSSKYFMDASSVLIFQCLSKKNQTASRHKLLIVFSILYTDTLVHVSIYYRMLTMKMAFLISQ